MKSTRTASARCANCFEKGHYARECKRKKKAKICAMCGGKGHLDDRCPRSICFKVIFLVIFTIEKYKIFILFFSVDKNHRFSNLDALHVNMLMI